MTLALHGSTAAIHDHVAGRPGDYDVVLAALRSADAVEVTSHVTRANARNLAELAQRLTEDDLRPKVRRWILAWPGPQPPGLSLPRLGMVAPRVLHAAAMARQAGLEAVTSGLPTCVLGPHAKFAIAGASRTYPGVCEGCGARAECPGVPQGYVQAFGRDLELRRI